MTRKNNSMRPTTPGQLYKNITAIGETFSEEDSGVMHVEKDPAFVQYCKKMGKKFPSFRKDAVFSEKHKQAIAFLGWRLSPGDFMAAIKGTFITGIIPIVLIIAIVFFLGVGLQVGTFNTADLVGGPLLYNLFSDEQMVMMSFAMLSVILIGVLGAGVYMVYSYPIGAASDEKNRALTYVPEMIGYMIMSMKLVPNLEKAIEFSAKHGRGRIAVEFKRLIWDFQLGLYSSIAEGVDNLAYRWGEYSSELKEALMKIRASVMEPSESQRYQVLDKTMLEVLESVKGKMEDYARSLSQPSIMLFYLGVLLPLILIIVLPVGSAFSGNALATPPLLIGIYCIGIPLACYMFAKRVIDKRPPTYEPPIIEDDFYGLPKKWHMQLKKGSIDIRLIFVIIVAIGLFASFIVSVEGIPPKSLMGGNDFYDSPQIISADRDLGQILKDNGRDPDYLGKKVVDLYVFDTYDVKEGKLYTTLREEGMAEKLAYEKASQEYLQFTSNPKNDPTKFLFWSGAIITLALAGSLVLYYKNIYKRKAQLGIIKMEDEFKESMYVIASRMGENKPVESALKHARDFLPGLLISKRIFGKTVENIELMGLPLEGAVFDPVYGSMKGIPSKVLRTAMQLLVDSVSLGVEVASRTLMSLSLQMENMDKVNKSLKNLVSDVTTTMSTMAIFIGPIVLGITVALQKVVMMTLAGVVADPAVVNADSIGDLAGTGMSINNLFQLDVATFQSFASPLMFLLIIAIYVAEIVIIMMYFTVKVQEDNNLLFRVTLARALPIAVIIFVLTALGSSIAVASLMGG